MKIPLNIAFFLATWNQTWNQTFLQIFDDPIQPVGFAGISCTSKNQRKLRCAPDGRLPWISGSNKAGAIADFTWLGDPRNQMLLLFLGMRDFPACHLFFFFFPAANLAINWGVTLAIAAYPSAFHRLVQTHIPWILLFLSGTKYIANRGLFLPGETLGVCLPCSALRKTVVQQPQRSKFNSSTNLYIQSAFRGSPKYRY